MISRAILLVLVLFSIALSTERVWADAAPLGLPGGAALDPGDAATQVRMVAETVTLEVAPPNQEPIIEAQVSAEFTMRNLGNIPEQILVGFPLSCDWCMVDEAGYFEEIDDLTVYVNTKQVATRREELTFQSSSELLSVSWAVFNVTFPPGVDVFIRITYTAGGTGGFLDSYRTFSYVLITGAGWYDTIGSADIIARLPYPANDQNTWIEMSGLRGDGDKTPPTVSGNELRWHFDDLEPTRDFKLTIVHPWQWFSALVEEENVRLNPQDGEAWGRLGRAYKQMLPFHNFIRTDPGGEALYARAAEAYQRATTLLPDDPWWHAGFAELLFTHFYYAEYQFGANPLEDLSTLSRAVDEVRLALSIDPDNELAQDILDRIESRFPEAIQVVDGQPDYPILTSTAVLSDLLWSPTSTPGLPTLPKPTSTTRIMPASTPVSPIISTVMETAPTSRLPVVSSPSPTQPLTPTAGNPIPSDSSGDLAPLWVAGVLVILIIGLSRLLHRKHA